MNDTEPSRPSTARRVSFEEPAANDTTSPAKEHPDTTRLATPTTNTTGHLPENIPPPRSYLDSLLHSSFFESPVHPGHSDSQAEIAVRQHLQDIESSFLSPVPLSSISGLHNLLP